MNSSALTTCTVSFLFLIAVILILPIPLFAAENLITNPSVESGGYSMPDNWLREKRGPNLSLFQYQRRSGYDGSRSVAIDVTSYQSGYSSWYFAPVAVNNDKQYEYTVYYQTAAETDVVLRAYAPDGTFTDTVIEPLSPATTWTQYKTEFTAPAGATSVTILHKTKRLGKVSFDTFSLVELSDSTVPTTPPTDNGTTTATTTPPTGTGTTTPTSTPPTGTGTTTDTSTTPGGTGTTTATSTPPTDNGTTTATSTPPTGNATSTATTTPPTGNGTTTATTTPPTDTGTTDSAPTTVVNLIPNSSFEIASPTNPNRPAYWNPRKYGQNDAVFAYDSEADDGNRSIRVDVTNYVSGTAYFLPEPYAVEGGKTYEFSYRYRANAYAEVDAAYYMSDGTVEYAYLGVSVPSPNSWSTFTTRVTIPDGAVRASIYGLLYTNGYFVSDTYSLTEEQIVPLAKPIVTLTFDDAFTSFYDNAFPLFQQYDMAGTMYLVSQDFSDPFYMTSTQLLELESSGFEMGSHSVTHAHLPQLSLSELRYELTESKQKIEEKLGHEIKNFATPYGEYNDQVVDEIMKVYGSHRSVDVGYNTKDNFSRRNIRSMSPINSTSATEVLDWVDTAIANNAWLTITYHDIVDNGGTFTNTPAHLETVLSGLSARGVSVMTTEGALQYIESTQ